MNQTHPSIDQIVDYLHGELSATEDAAIHAHLAGCPACEERRAGEVALTEALRAHARAAERDLPERVAKNIRDAVERSRPSPAWERLRAAFRPVVMLPAAAALAAALYFGLNAWHGASGPTPIDTSYYVENHAALAASVPLAEDVSLPVMLTSSDETQ
jgi:anti-sigma factor RsiW